MNNPKYSIIIPVKNEEIYLKKTLKSLVAEKAHLNHHVEIIVVDGGSTDNSVEVSKRYADVVISDSEYASKNIASGRNVGANVAKGEYLIHTDADVIFPNLGKLLEQIEKQFVVLSVVAMTTKIKPYPEERRLKDLFFHWIFNSAIRLSIPIGAFLAKGECQIVRKDSFNLVGGYNDSIIVGEDCALFYNLKKIGKIVYLKHYSVWHSTRRFRKLGYLITLLIYAREGFFLLFFKRSYLATWESIR